MAKTIQYAHYPKLRERKVTKTYEQGYGQNGGVSSLGTTYEDTDSDGVLDTIVKDSPRIGAFKRTVGVVNRSYLPVPPPVIAVPVITSNGGGAAAAISIAENSTAVTTVTVSGTGITYTKSGTDAGLFTIDSSTGVLAFASAPDYETPGDGNSDNDYELTVTATNSAGADSQNITVTVTDVLEVDQIDPALVTLSATIYANTGESSGTLAYGTDTQVFYIWNGMNWNIHT